MTRFDQTQMQQYLLNVDQRMAAANSQLAGFSQSVNDVYANWLGYRNLESDPVEESAASDAFAAKCREMVDGGKASLARSLDIIAGGMKDDNGDPLTRQDLLDELAAVPMA